MAKMPHANRETPLIF